MANVNRPSGLSPVRNLGSSTWNEAATMYFVPSTNTDAFYIGDLVIPAEGADPKTNSPYCAKAAASSTGLLGVVVGIGVTPNRIYEQQSAPATKTQGYYIYVVDDPNTVFEMTDDGLTAGLTGVEVGQNADYTVAAPSGISPVSATVIDSGSIGTTDTLPLKIIGLKRSSDNVAGPYARWLVKINQHVFVGPKAGV